MSDVEVSDLQIYHEEKFVVDYRGTAHTFDSKDEAAAFIYGVECSRNLPDIEGTPASMPTGEDYAQTKTEAITADQEQSAKDQAADPQANSKTILGTAAVGLDGFSGY